MLALACQDNTCCVNQQTTQPPVSTFQDDINVNLPAPLPQAHYVGTAVVNGLSCDGWEFVWDADNLPVVQWVHTDPSSGAQVPVRTQLPHNGRSIQYNYQTATPDELLYSLHTYKTTCPIKNPCPS